MTSSVVPTLAGALREAKWRADDRYRRLALDRRFRLPRGAVLSLERTDDVLLRCSAFSERFDPQTHLRELAFAHELGARGRRFAVTSEPASLFGKSVVWFVPDGLVSPPLWDHSRQVSLFAEGLERQGNRLFCSSAETGFWENKAHMHRKLAEIGAATPATLIVTAADRIDFDFEPVLVKQEHSAGSAGVHYFESAADARRFVDEYEFRPTESLIVQELVSGATRDMRVTMVGNTMIVSASFWRVKSAEALARPEWTSTASKYGSAIEHRDIPESVAPLVAEYLRALGLRTAGVDLIWPDDDLSRDPLVLEVSPFYQPNPEKPTRYDHLSYKDYKSRPYSKDGYFERQYQVFREIAAAVLDQGLY